MASSLLALPDTSNFSTTCAVSLICGIALGDTKLPKSMVSNPTFKSRLMYWILTSVGMNASRPCIASRGHSIIFIQAKVRHLADENIFRLLAIKMPAEAMIEIQENVSLQELNSFGVP